MNHVRQTLAWSVRVASKLPPWIDATFVAVLCVAAALTALGTWHADAHVPYLAVGDASATQYMIKTVLEHGWYTHNPDVGAPFGATMYDFPIPEPTNFVLVRVLGFFGKDPFLVYNLFYLFSFASVGLAAWWGFRRFEIGRPLAIAGAFLFSMMPYHFLRLPHLFLASYFAAPIFATYATRLSLYRAPHLFGDLRISLGVVLLLAMAAGAGIYYAFFGCLFIAMGGAMGWIGGRRKEPLLFAGAYITVIVSVVALSLLPNAIYHWLEGANSLVAQREPQDAEIYGLRLTQLLLPAAGHRFPMFAEWIGRYNSKAPLLTENATATLGLLASFGLIAAMSACLLGSRSRFRTVAAVGALAIGGILFATIGGFGSLFALLITPEMRGLNRISIFIAFFALAATLILAHRACGARPLANAAIALGMIIIGWYDEVPTTRIANPQPIAFQKQQAFFDSIQNMLSRGSSVYELPYMFFPENPRTATSGAFFSYDLFQPYLRTKGLRWSFGDMHGRAADAWNEQVSTLDGADLVNVLGGAGFSAIYVNRAGYADHAIAIEKTIASVLGAPSLEDSSHDLAVYKIPATRTPVLPFVVVAPGRGWYPWEKDAHQDPFGWSKGSADLLVANPGATSQVVVQFNVMSSRARHLEVRCGNKALGDYDLKANTSVAIKFSFVANAGISRIDLHTDAAATPGSVVFRLDNLAYGATAFE